MRAESERSSKRNECPFLCNGAFAQSGAVSFRAFLDNGQVNAELLSCTNVELTSTRMVPNTGGEVGPMDIASVSDTSSTGNTGVCPQEMSFRDSGALIFARIAVIELKPNGHALCRYIGMSTICETRVKK